VVALLNENRYRLDRLAQALLEHEALDEDDAYAAAGAAPPVAPLAQPLALAARATTDASVQQGGRTDGRALRKRVGRLRI
jgi:hypothetical protein